MGKLQSLKIVFSKPLGRGFEKTNQGVGDGQHTGM
jgi:hypothetical protein